MKKLWLACILSLYPAYFLASFLVFAAPPLTRVAFADHQLTRLSVTVQGISATSAPSVPVPARRGAGGPSIPAAVTAAVVLSILAWKFPIPAGLVLAMIGAVAAPQVLLRSLFMNHWRTEDIATAALFLLILCLGLRFLLNGIPAQTFPQRVGILYAAFVLPIAVTLLSAGSLLFRRQGPVFYLPMLIAPAALGALLASAWPSTRTARSFTWRPVGGLIAVTLLIALAGRTGVQAFNNNRRDATGVALAAIPPPPVNAPYPKLFFQKGVNFTAESPGGYPSENARQMLRSLPKHGVNAIALVPYGFTRQNTGTVGWSGGMEGDDGIEQLSRVAHQLNVKVLLKPQIWVQPGYPGDLHFSTAETRNQWFAEYSKFIEHQAELAKRVHADLFCVGVEFKQLVQYEADWRKIIARARAIYPGPIVYAATQGEEFEGIQFWDALDYIGLNNYYPLPDDLSTTAIVQKVEIVQKKFQKPVLFTEAGFASFEGSHREPWSEKQGTLAVAAQARCYEAILQAFYNKPWFQGVYWWKVGTDGHGGPEDLSLTPWGKPAMEVVARWFLQPGR